MFVFDFDKVANFSNAGTDVFCNHFECYMFNIYN